VTSGCFPSESWPAFDLVRNWASVLEESYGFKGKFYPNRNSNEIRWYVDMDDRQAEQVLKDAEKTPEKPQKRRSKGKTTKGEAKPELSLEDLTNRLDRLK
jgi:hypothetical protein